MVSEVVLFSAAPHVMFSREPTDGKAGGGFRTELCGVNEEVLDVFTVRSFKCSESSEVQHTHI